MIDFIAERLEDRAVCPRIVNVVKARDIETLRSYAETASGAVIMVHMEDETAFDTGTDGCLRYNISREFAADLCCYSDQFEDVRSELLAALIGWNPGDSTEWIQYSGGSVQHMDANFIIYTFNFFINSLQSLSNWES